MSRQLYSPSDTALDFTYGAQKFTLSPNAVQGVEGYAFDHALEYFRKLGVREVFGNDGDAAIKAEAEQVHTDWLCDVAGVPRPKPVDPHVAAARAALVKRGIVKENA